mmetsp:Transcript_1467/g.3502  ORF Transcript_1467/g.3502 Transcript_1467/m.3502 type:complete len:169 (+) Transcript_1467:263-769(+)
MKVLLISLAALTYLGTARASVLRGARLSFEDQIDLEGKNRHDCIQKCKANPPPSCPNDDSSCQADCNKCCDGSSSQYDVANCIYNRELDDDYKNDDKWDDNWDDDDKNKKKKKNRNNKDKCEKAKKCSDCKDCKDGSNKKKKCKDKCSLEELKFWFPEDFINAMEEAA